MKLQEIMMKDVAGAAPDETIGLAGKRMGERAVGCLVIAGTDRRQWNGLPRAGKFATPAALDKAADSKVKHAI